MNIDHIATSLIDRANHSPGDVPLDHPYRQRWWLPIIGPSATCILDHLATSDESPSSWKVTPALELATAIGLGKGTGRNSPSFAASTGSPGSGSGTGTSSPARHATPVSASTAPSASSLNTSRPSGQPHSSRPTPSISPTSTARRA